MSFKLPHTPEMYVFSLLEYILSPTLNIIQGRFVLICSVLKTYKLQWTCIHVRSQAREKNLFFPTEINSNEYLRNSVTHVILHLFLHYALSKSHSFHYYTEFSIAKHVWVFGHKEF